MQPYCFNTHDLIAIYVYILKNGFNVRWSKGELDDYIWDASLKTKTIIIRKYR